MGRKASLEGQDDGRSLIAAALLWCTHKAAGRIECPLLCSKAMGPLDFHRFTPCSRMKQRPCSVQQSPLGEWLSLYSAAILTDALFCSVYMREQEVNQGKLKQRQRVRPQDLFVFNSAIAESEICSLPGWPLLQCELATLEPAFPDIYIDEHSALRIHPLACCSRHPL